MSSIIDAAFSRFILPAGKLALVQRIAEKLVAIEGHKPDLAAADNVAKLLRRLLVEGHFELPNDAVSTEDFKSRFLDGATAAIETALIASGQPHLAGAARLTAGAVKWLNTQFDRCGGTDRGDPPPGPEVEMKNGRPVVVFWIEEDQNGMPMLPAINGSPMVAFSRISNALQSWQLKLKLDVAQTHDRTGANLIISGRVFGPEVDDAVLALTDIGPPSGRQLRMIFDLAEVGLSKTQFEATVAHEFGHALGIRHADVRESAQLMNPMLSEISEPRDGDLRAAAARGWMLS